MSEPQPIVLTGISSELGAILATELAKDPDVQIIGTMRRAVRSEDTFPSNILVLDRCDLTDAECCARIADTVTQNFTSAFGFIHSVGDFWDHKPFLDLTMEQAQKVFESHVGTLYNTSKILLPVMQAKGGGSCITFSCNSARYNYPWMAPFTASKSAVDSLVRSLANEFSGQNIRFNSLVLSSLRTEKVRKSKPHGDFAHFIPPKDIVPIIRFLLSKAASLINGNMINLFVHSDDFYNSGYFRRIAK
jgi:NAD(P)-dependent dehydrogenase (short-subunit alcohol dehydrogenase family)